MALFTVYIHCFFEWVFLTSLPFYLFAMTAGLVAGLAQQLGYWENARAPHFSMGQTPTETKQREMTKRAK